jgi:hypothetical protein
VLYSQVEVLGLRGRISQQFPIRVTRKGERVYVENMWKYGVAKKVRSLIKGKGIPK